MLDFFIIGVQKGGTTALDAILRRHPGVQMGSPKELHFFDDEARVDWQAPAYDRLHASYDWGVGGVVRGEATPIYVYWPQALERLQRYNPASKLILLLRHPAFRAHSQWRMQQVRGSDDMSFDDVIAQPGRMRMLGHPGGVHRTHSYIERGRYADQINRLLALFPRNQVLMARTDRLWSDPVSTMRSVTNFLAVPPLEQVSAQYIVPFETRRLGTITSDQRAKLTDIFRDDIRATSALSGLDLSDWLSPDYVEPMPLG